MNTVLQYIALTGSSKNTGLTESQFKQMMSQETPRTNENDKLPGEDAIQYMKRKKEAIRAIERQRTDWLKK